MKRPWGLLHHMFGRLNAAEPWNLIGAISFEERCTGTLETLHASKKLGRKLFFRIADQESDYTAEANRKTDLHLKTSYTFGIADVDIRDLNIMFAGNQAVAMVNEFLNGHGENIILDISCLPKRLFFLCLKLLVANQKVKNLIVTYGIPEGYTQESLALDTDPIGTLPLFGALAARPEDPEVIIIGVGYLPFDLAGYRNQLPARVPEKVLFPFPPGPPSFQRNWRFLLDIFGEAESDVIPEPIRVDARDVSYAFDVIDDITFNGKLNACLMPFGPKPHSLAMALHFLKPGSKDQVLYTQPKAYHYDYSIGLKRIEGIPEVYGYFVKSAGKNLYQ